MSDPARVTKSFLVRIYETDASGPMVGRLTDIESGVAAVFRTLDELVTLLQGAAAEGQARRQSTEEQN